MNNLILKLRKLWRNLSVKAGIFSLGALGAALGAIFIAPYVPDVLADLLGGEAVDRILTIIASSMLVVVTFSLSTLVATFSVITGRAPPRAAVLVIEDSRAQTALSTFLGAFIFSIVSLVALSTGYYGKNGRVVLFFITIFVLSSVIWTIIRWIGQLSKLGQLEYALNRVETIVEKTIFRQTTHFEWHSSKKNTPPDSAWAIQGDETTASGFVQSVDLDQLSNLAESAQLKIYVQLRVGEFANPKSVFIKVQGPEQDEDFYKKIRSCFVFGKNRSFDEDSRYGFVVISEIASLALSSGINDPGTAIQVLACLTRLFFVVRAPPEKSCDDIYSKNLYLKFVSADELFDDAFRSIARDGAAMIEVGVFLQKSLNALAQFPEFKKAALFQSKEALERCQNSITNKNDLLRVQNAAVLQ